MTTKTLDTAVRAAMEAWDATDGSMAFRRARMARFEAAVRKGLAEAVSDERSLAVRQAAAVLAEWAETGSPAEDDEEPITVEEGAAIARAARRLEAFADAAEMQAAHDIRNAAPSPASPSVDPAEFTSAEDVLVWLSGFGGGENQPTVAAVREAIAFARADIADRLQTARADVYESVSRERDEASAALLTEQDRTAALRSALARLIDAAAPHVGAEYATEEETRALRNALKNAREDMR